MRKQRKFVWRAAAAILAGTLLVAQPCVAMASGKTAGASRVEEMVAILPESSSIAEKDAQSVMDAMKAYWALTMAEQASVDPDVYKKLDDDYRACVTAGYIEDAEKKAEREKEEQERASREQAALALSSEVETDATQYVFELTNDSPTASILIRYTLDLNNDGNGDPPSRITLTSPDGEPYVISQGEESAKKDGLYIMYQWQPTYVQIDIAEAKAGKWMLETSDPVGFTKMEYAGIREKIEPADKEKEEDAENTENLEEEEEIQPEEEQGGFGILPIFLVIMLLGVFAFMIFMIKYKPFEKNDDGEDEDAVDKRRPRRGRQDDEEYFARPASEEEIAEQMRREYLEQQEEELRAEADDDDDEDEDDEDETMDNAPDDDEDDDGFFDEYTEGESGLLRAEDSPFEKGGGLREDDETEALTDDDDEDEEDEDFFNTDM